MKIVTPQQWLPVFAGCFLLFSPSSVQLQEYSPQYFNAPFDAIECVKVHWNEKIQPGNDVYIGFRILTLGPVPVTTRLSGIHDGDLMAWIEAELNIPEWNNPHTNMFTLISSHSGKWEVEETLGAVGESPIINPTTVFLPRTDAWWALVDTSIPIPPLQGNH